MSLYRKVQAVEKVFNHLEKEVAAFKKATSLKCLSGCGLCCYKQDITASVLEFLPLAYHLHKAGRAHFVMESIMSNSDKSLCINLKNITHIYNENGSCGEYANRGLICRLFGFSAMTDKNGSNKLVTCYTLKTRDPNVFTTTTERINDGLKVPVMRDYYYRLRFIDPDLGTELIPINQAILNAIKVVLGYYSYRSPQRPRRAG